MPEPKDPAFQLSAQLVDDFSKLCPVQASMAGVPGAWDGWDDYSAEGGIKVRALLASYRTRLDALPAATERWAKLARRVMADFLEEKDVYFAHGDNLCDLNNIESPLQHMRVVFDVMDTTGVVGWSALAKRLETIDQPLAGYRAALETGAARGLVPARRQVRACIVQSKAHASESSSYLALLTSFDAAKIDDASLRARIASGIDHARDAFRDFGGFLESFLERATPDDAFGAERYARAAFRFNGMKIDPVDTYAWGFTEVRSIEAAMQELSHRIAPGKSTREVVDALSTSETELVRDHEKFLELMRARQQRALDDLEGKHFDVPAPIRRIEVKLAPAGTALGAYYIPPNEDFSRPGTVFYAPAPGHEFALFSEITTAYHEGFPGHHLQCGLQVFLSERLSRLHRLFVVCSGYAEGWALYAEQLMDELGYFEKPEYLLGMHMAKLFRACRVVVDIGVHHGYAIPKDFDFHPGEVWNYELAVEFLTTRGLIPRPFAESEATRYLGWPGQAISYKVGERVILDLRREMRERLGDRFDLRKFHEAVLSSGSVGLDLLREIVHESLDA